MARRAKTIPLTNQEKYEVVGFLARPGIVQNIEAQVPTKNLAKFKVDYKGKLVKPYEITANKRANQYRITVTTTEGCPNALLPHINSKNRINASGFIVELVNDFGFVFSSGEQNSELIRGIVEEIGTQEYDWFKEYYYVKENSINKLKLAVSSATHSPKLVDPLSEKGKKSKATKKTKNKTKNIGHKATQFTEEQLASLGWIGEMYLYKQLIGKDAKILEKFGISGDFVVEWFNEGFDKTSEWEDKSVGKGCDMYVDCNGERLFVEVKSSERKPGYFSITGKELEMMKKHDDDYYLVKIDYLKRILDSQEAEVGIIKSPYGKLFTPKQIKSATIKLGIEEEE